MQEIAVESSTVSAQRKLLLEAGFDDDQARAVIDVTGTGSEQLALRTDLAELRRDVTVLKQDVAVLKQQTASLNERFDSFRDEVAARIEASEGRVKSEIASVRSEIATLCTEIRGHVEALRLEAKATAKGQDDRTKLIVWLLGAGLTLYTGTVVSLMFLLFRGVVA